MDVNSNNIFISNLVETKNNSKYLIRYLNEFIRPLVFILPKMGGCIKTFKGKDGYKIKNNKLMSLRIYDNKLWETYDTIWTKIDDLKNIELNALTVYDDRYVKIKVRIYGDNGYTTFRWLDAPEDGAECKPFTVISIDSLLAYDNKY